MGVFNSRPDPNQDVIIFVVGATGAGKSYLINTAVGHHAVDVGASLEPCTTTVRSIRCNYRSRQVTFVDTPAIQLDIQSLDDLEKQLEGWMKKARVQRQTVAGILYLHKISDNRITKPSASNMTAFERLCGEDVSRKIILVTTMWNSTEEEIGDIRETEIKTKYWNNMLLSGSHIMRFDNTANSVWTAVDLLIQSH